jgi:bifunctional non-homologous end joining protein LigD
VLATYPTFVRPCRPIRAIRPPSDNAWVHEPKLDGHRLQIVKFGRQVKLYSECGYDWSSRLPRLAEALKTIPCQAAVIDSELCFLNASDAPDYHPERGITRLGWQHKIAVFAFDLLHRSGMDLRPLPLLERRRQLTHLMARGNVPCLRILECFNDGEKLLEAAERQSLEGIVSKRRTAPYHSGDCCDWVTTKTLAWRTANRERWRFFD